MGNYMEGRKKGRIPMGVCFDELKTSTLSDTVVLADLIM
jgi:hypothetical protein